MIYLDTSAIVPLFLPEPRSQEVEDRILNQTILVSDLARAEFSSAIAMATRSGRIPADTGHAVFKAFDAWMEKHAITVQITGEDFARATRLIRRFELALRTPDALHIAAATRLDARLLTYDTQMLAAASRLGLSCVL